MLGWAGVLVSAPHIDLTLQWVGGALLLAYKDELLNSLTLPQGRYCGVSYSLKRVKM